MQIDPLSIHWWFKTNAGLGVRIAIGVAIFALLGTVDLIRNGRAAQRWREYAFLLLAAALGVGYGAANDAFTSSVSWEYYFYGKGLAQEMPSQTPPNANALRRQAMLIGTKAGGSAGILIGAALLIANNPRAGRRRLTYRQLSFHLAGIFSVTIVCSLLLGAAGAMGWLLWTSNDLADLWKSGDMRPRRFLAVYGVHLGAYVSGAIGTAAALLHIFCERRARSSANTPVISM